MGTDEARAVLISRRNGRGDVRLSEMVSEGNKASEFKPKPERVGENKPLTVKEFFEEWILRKKPPFVRRSLERDYQQAFNKNIIPFMGDLDLNNVTIDTLEDFRMHLVEERRLSVKSCAEHNRRFTPGDVPRCGTTDRAEPVQRSSR